jgi:hypothetical protein
MNRSPKSSGKIVDELIVNPKRLTVVHVCLGVLSAGAYWIRPGTSTPHLPIYNIRDPSPIIISLIAWLPYVVSFKVSRHLLENRSQVSVIVFGILAAIITGFAIALYFDLIVNILGLSPIQIPIAVTSALIGAAYLCAVIWPKDTSD